jgi:3-deoxy-manno-octulosonate cytidylyltransferase (CMP-KDO synthetase)
MKVLGVIPARYASTRFMGKPLVEIQGKTMIQRVYEQAQKAKSLTKVVVATDDDRIYQHVLSFGGEVVMTSEAHQSGTDRCAEVIDKVNTDMIINSLGQNKPPVFYGFKPAREKVTFDAVVNIQGDEPFIDPSQIDKVVDILKNTEGGEGIATLAIPLKNLADIQNPNMVKVVFNAQGKAVYFSRSPIPYVRHTPIEQWHTSNIFFKHIGLYAYTKSVLREIAQLPPSRLEQLEALEQLRWLENGYTIGVGITDIETIGIDTPEDLEKINVSHI